MINKLANVHEGARIADDVVVVAGVERDRLVVDVKYVGADVVEKTVIV